MKSPGYEKLTRGFDADCRFTRDILSLVGDKWSVLVIVALGAAEPAAAPIRFSDLKRTIEGISQRMLTHTLRGLERDGLVDRTVHPTNPPRVDYGLTALGRTLLGPVAGLAVWAQKHRGPIQKAREAFERAVATGER